MEQEQALGRDERGQHLLASYLEEASPGKGNWHKVRAKDHPTGRAILEAGGEEQVSVLFATFHLPAARQLFMKVSVVQPLIQDLFRRGLTISEPDLLCLCQGGREAQRFGLRFQHEAVARALHGEGGSAAGTV